MRDAAAKTGVAPSYFSAIEMGRRGAGRAVIEKLARGFFTEDSFESGLENLLQLSAAVKSERDTATAGKAIGGNLMRLSMKLGSEISRMLDLVADRAIDQNSPLEVADLDGVLFSKKTGELEGVLYLDWSEQLFEVRVSTKRLTDRSKMLRMARWTGGAS